MDNIWSGSNDPMLAALTNPTEISFRKRRITKHYPLIVCGVEYSDLESAYMKLRSGPRDLATMRFLIAEKFYQYPELVAYVENRGGLKWLWGCNHFTGAKTERFKWWEGISLDSPFIDTLCCGYQLFLDGQRWRCGATTYQEKFL